MNTNCDVLQQLAGYNIIYLEKCDSTNSTLMEGMESFPDKTLVYTQNQIKGRGRLSRQWDNPGYSGLALSVLYKGIDAALPISLIFGLAASRAITAHGCPCTVKWPNDVLCGNKKLAGILCETKYSATVNAVLGIGINLTQPREYFDGQSLPNAGSILSQSGISPNPAEIICAIIMELEALYFDYNERRFMQEYISNCITIGKEITADNRTGIATGISPSGALIARSNTGSEFTITSGEVSIQNIY